MDVTPFTVDKLFAAYRPGRRDTSALTTQILSFEPDYMLFNNSIFYPKVRRWVIIVKEPNNMASHTSFHPFPLIFQSEKAENGCIHLLFKNDLS